MNNQVRTHSTQTWLKEQSEMNDILHLKVGSTMSSHSDEVIIEFGHETDQGGSEKMSSLYAEAPSLYIPKNEKHYSISFLTDISLHPTVKLAFKAGISGVYSIERANTTFVHDVILEDLKTGTLQDFKQNHAYNFFADTSDDPNRFVLHFKALGTNDGIRNENISVYYGNGWLNISGIDDTPTTVEVYNTAGSKIDTWKLSKGGTHRKSLDMKPGVYIVKMYSSKLSSSTRIIVF